MRTRHLLLALVLGLVVGQARADAPEGYAFLSFDEGMRVAQADDHR